MNFTVKVLLRFIPLVLGFAIAGNVAVAQSEDIDVSFGPFRYQRVQQTATPEMDYDQDLEFSQDLDLESFPVSTRFQLPRLYNLKDGGSVLKAGSQILFFEGLTERESNYVYNSIVYGGIVPAAFSRILSLAGNEASHWGFSTFAQLLRFSEFVFRPVHIYYCLSHLHHVASVGPWYAIPYYIHTFTGHLSRTSVYTLSATIQAFLQLENLANQVASTKNTQYINIPLGGSASRKFFIKAQFLHEPVYILYHTGHNEPNEGDVFSRLSHTLSAYDINQLTIKPLPTYGFSQLEVTFIDPRDNSTIYLHIKGSQDESDHTPWLLHTIHKKHLRTAVTNARFALTPTLLSATAEAIEMYFSTRTRTPSGLLPAIDEDNYLFTAELAHTVTGKIGDVRHQNGSSEFVIDDGELVLHWYDGYFWPKLSLTPVVTDNNRFTQWLVPQWLGNFLVTEIAHRGRVAAYQATALLTDSAVTLVATRPVSRIRTSVSLRDGFKYWLEPASLDEHARFDLQLTRNDYDPHNPDSCLICLENIHGVGAYKSPCCNQVYLCPDCQQDWARRQYKSGEYKLDPSVLPPESADGDIGIKFKCLIPSCNKGGVPAVMHNAL